MSWKRIVPICTFLVGLTLAGIGIGIHYSAGSGFVVVGSVLAVIGLIAFCEGGL